MADLPRLERRPEVRAFSVEALLQYAQEGRLRLPSFVRPPQWRSSDVLDFFDSLYRGFPAGALLLARQPAEAGPLHFGPVQINAPSVPDALLVLDGQQRLTALTASLLHPDPLPRGDIHAVWFDLAADRFRRLEGPNPPLHWIPLNAIADPLRLLKWLSTWPLGPERQDLAQRATALSTALKTYQFPAYVLERASDEELRLIVERIHHSGRLRAKEPLKVTVNIDSREPVTGARRRLTQTGFGTLSEEDFFDCLEAVEEWMPGQVSPGTPQEATFPLEAINRTETAVRRAITFLMSDAGVPHLELLPHRLPLSVLSKFFFLHSAPPLRTRLLLSRWLWRGALSGAHAAHDATLGRRLLSGITYDPHASVEFLLKTVPRASAPPAASIEWDLRTVPTKLCAIALFHLHPRDPETHAVLDLNSFQELLLRRDITDLFPDVGRTRPSTVARHVLLPDPSKLALLPAATPDVLHSHGMDEEAAEALRRQAWGDFEQRRARVLDSWFERFFNERSAPDESDRPPVTELLRRVDQKATPL